MGRRRFVCMATLLLCVGLVGQAQAAAPRAFYGVMAADRPGLDRDRPDGRRQGRHPADQLRLGRGSARRRAQRSTGATTTRSSAPRPSRASACSRPSTAPRLGRRAGRTTRRRRPTSASSGPSSRGGRSATGATAPSGPSNPTIPKLPVTDWQLWNEMNSPSFWFQQAEREAVRRPAPGLPRRRSRAATRAPRSCWAGCSGPRGSRTGSRWTATCPAIYRRQGQEALRRGRPSIRTRRPRRTP